MKVSIEVLGTCLSGSNSSACDYSYWTNVIYVDGFWATFYRFQHGEEIETKGINVTRRSGWRLQVSRVGSKRLSPSNNSGHHRLGCPQVLWLAIPVCVLSHCGWEAVTPTFHSTGERMTRSSTFGLLPDSALCISPFSSFQSASFPHNKLYHCFQWVLSPFLHIIKTESSCGGPLNLLLKWGQSWKTVLSDFADWLKHCSLPKG